MPKHIVGRHKAITRPSRIVRRIPRPSGVKEILPQSFRWITRRNEKLGTGVPIDPRA